MKELTVEEIQKKGLEMLEYFDRFASENNIRYFLSGGTLLGAVRHQGFIPWDDDVDLMAPRKDYERIISEFKETDRYKVLSCHDDDYEYDYARIIDKSTILEWKDFKTMKMGVFIDLFPIDGFPRSRFFSNLHSFHIFIVKNIWASSMTPGEQYNAHIKTIRKIIRFFSRRPNVYSRRINKIAQKYDYDKCEYAGVAVTVHYLYKERNRRAIYDDTVMLKFEHLMLPAPKHYEEYLGQLYGNYMQLPPMEKRFSEHMFTAWNKE